MLLVTTVGHGDAPSKRVAVWLSHPAERAPALAEASGFVLEGCSVGRYYDPTTGQFLTVDPLVNETNVPYSYAGDDPLNAGDPTGDYTVSDAGSDCVPGPTGLDVCPSPNSPACANLYGPYGTANQMCSGSSLTLGDIAGTIWNGVKSFATGFVGNAPGCNNNGAAYDTGNAAWWALSIGGLLGGFSGAGTSDEGPPDAPELAAGATSAESAAAIQQAEDVLSYVESHAGAAPPGYVGGGTFYNSEGLLPGTDAEGNPISYREYDVNPYEKGVNRGAERLVVGSNGSAYYTNDHYQSFTPLG